MERHNSKNTTALNELTILARVHYKYGQLEKAYDILQQVLSLQEKLLMPDCIEIAYTLYNLGQIRCDQGYYGLAKPLYLRAMSIWHKHNPEAAPNWMSEAEFQRKLEEKAAELDEAIPPSLTEEETA